MKVAASASENRCIIQELMALMLNVLCLLLRAQNRSQACFNLQKPSTWSGCILSDPKTNFCTISGPIISSWSDWSATTRQLVCKGPSSWILPRWQGSLEVKYVELSRNLTDVSAHTDMCILHASSFHARCRLQQRRLQMNHLHLSHISDSS